MSLEDIKVGDIVIVSSYSEESLDKVCEVTKTLIITSRYRFRKANGNLFGGGRYCQTYARKGTDEEIDRIKKAESREYLYVSIKSILRDCYPSLKDCEDIYSIIEKYKK